MAKRLISTNERSELVLQDLQKNGQNISQYMNAALLDEIGPVYSSLRTESLYLLDCVATQAKEWVGSDLLLAGKTEMVEASRDVQFICRQTLGRGVTWLSKHHVQNMDVLRTAVNLFQESPLSGGIQPEKLNSSVRDEMEVVQKKLHEIDPNYNFFDVGLGSLGRGVLDNWNTLWDWNGAYNIIASVMCCENLISELDPIHVVRILQLMENQFIIEAIGEKTK